MSDQPVQPGWLRLWQRSCFVVAGAAFLIPALGLLLFGPNEGLQFVALLFVGIAALGARSAVVSWVDTQQGTLPASRRYWIIAGLVVGILVALVGSIIELQAIDLGSEPVTAAVIALMFLSLVQMFARSYRDHNTTTLVLTLLLNTVIAWSAGYVIATGLTGAFGAGGAGAAAVLVVSALCGAGIGGWRYSVAYL